MLGTNDLDLDPLVGSSRLLSFRFIVSDTNEHVEPYGSYPNGRMVLTPAGRDSISHDEFRPSAASE